MYRFYKTICIVFLFLSCCLYRQKALAWQSGYAATQDTVYNNDTEEHSSSEEEEWSENVVEAPTEPSYSYNELHFYEADSLPPSTVKRNIADADWKKMTGDPAFQYEDQKPAITQEEEHEPGWFERAITAIFKFFASSTGKIIIIILVVLIILVLVFRVFQLNGNVFFSKRDKAFVHDDTDEAHHIPDDWEKEIQAAAQAGNYRLALRYSYRYLLTMLQERELIQFQVAKTNYQYVYELKDTGFHKPVMQLTRDYEYAWYGGFEIEKPFYESYQQRMQHIKKELNY